MKSNKTMIVGIACGVLCALCVTLYLMSMQGEVEKARSEALARFGGDQVEVCVAKRDLTAGEVVDESAVATKLWVADLLPEGAVTDPAKIVGLRLGSTIYKGEVICARRTETAAASLTVPAGQAALSLPARAVQAVGGSVEPGMRVDVYATGPTSTAPLVQRALVLASSASGSEGGQASDIAWLTLAVNPESVQEVVAAAQQLELYFVLPADTGASSAGASAIDPDKQQLPDGAPVEDADSPPSASPPQTVQAPSASDASAVDSDPASRN